MNKYMVILPNVHSEYVEADWIVCEAGVVTFWREGEDGGELFAVYPHGVMVQKVVENG